MKKTTNFTRILSIFMAIMMLMCIAVIPASAASYDTSYDKSIDELRILYPDGAYFNSSTKYNGISTYTWSPCSHAHGHCTYTGSCGCGTFKNLCIQCMGYAYAMQYYAFSGFNGYSYAKTNYNYTSAMASLKPGDVIRIGNHSVFVIAVNGDTITVAEANRDGHCKIEYGRTFSKQSIAGSFKYVDPAPRALKGAVNNSKSASSIRYYASVTARSGLNVRSGPSTGYSKVTAIPYGVTVPVYETSGNWAKVMYNGRTGWVSCDYLR